MSDPHRILARRLDAWLKTYDLEARLARSRSENWASATFSGARHLFAFAIESAEPGAPARIDRAGVAIAETEFRLPGHILADIGLKPCPGAPGEFTVEALTVEAG